MISIANTKTGEVKTFDTIKDASESYKVSWMTMKRWVEDGISFGGVFKVTNIQ